MHVEHKLSLLVVDGGVGALANRKRLAKKILQKHFNGCLEYDLNSRSAVIWMLTAALRQMKLYCQFDRLAGMCFIQIREYLFKFKFIFILNLHVVSSQDLEF